MFFMLFSLGNGSTNPSSHTLLTRDTGLSISARPTQHQKLSNTCLNLHELVKNKQIRTTLRFEESIFSKKFKKNEMLFFMFFCLQNASTIPSSHTLLTRDTGLSISARPTQHQKISNTCPTLHETVKNKQIGTTLRFEESIF